jgi:hypothetical protein
MIRGVMGEVWEEWVGGKAWIRKCRRGELESGLKSCGRTKRLYTGVGDGPVGRRKKRGGWRGGK